MGRRIASITWPSIVNNSRWYHSLFPIPSPHVERYTTDICWLLATVSVHISTLALLISTFTMGGEALLLTKRERAIAVSPARSKMGTLVDLLEVIGRRSGLPIVLCCSSRDGLDAVCANICSLPYISICCLHSDLGESERSTCLEKFRQAALEWMLKHDAESRGNEEDIKKQSSHVLVMTDSCLPMQTLGEAPVPAQVLINYDLPTKKEAYLRRLAACMSAIHISSSNKVTSATIPSMTATTTSTTNLSHGGIVINMVVGGEIVNLRSIEEGCSVIIEEMPIHISELL